MTQYKIPADSNLRYMPLVYFLPKDLLYKFPTLRTLPRNLRKILESEILTEQVNSDLFLNEIMDAGAALAFPHFDFGGWKEHYTGYCPVWQLSYAIPLWLDLLDKEIDLNLQTLFDLGVVPFFQPNYVFMIMERVVGRGIYEQNWQPILDVVREMPCDEDFEKWDTNVRKSFRRKWYHTRSKRFQFESLESGLDNGDFSALQVADNTADFCESVEGEDYVERFKMRLSQKDMEILELRVNGHTYEEIADKLGYKNHSGVLKRMRIIAELFEKHEDENNI